MYQALYRKWRPTTFDEVTGQGHITETLKAQVKNGRLSHAYLFTGTRGTGKTTCAKILARAVNCLSPVDGNPCNQCISCQGIENGSILDVLELDAASNSGVENIRILREEAVYSPAYCKTRVYIIDEVHMLSGAAFNALLKILEEPPAHLLFILATTELHKIPATILSRCQRFSFKRLPPEQIARRLNQVAQSEEIQLTEEGAMLLSRLADGSLRDALSLLDQCATRQSAVDPASILDILGLAGNLDTARLAKAIGGRDTSLALSIVSDLYSGGKEMGAILNALTALLRDVLIAKTVPGTATGLLTGGYQTDTLTELSQLFAADRLVYAISALQQTATLFPQSANRRATGEICIVRLCDESLDGTTDALSSRISRLEARIAQGRAIAPPPDLFSAPKEPLTPPPSATTGKAPIDEPPLSFDPPSPPETPPAAQEASEDPPLTEVPSKQPIGDELSWPQLLAAVKGKLDMPEYAILSNAHMVSCTYENGDLTLTVDSGFTKSMLAKAPVFEALANEAEALVSGPVRVFIRLKTEPAPYNKNAQAKAGDFPTGSTQFNSSEKAASPDIEKRDKLDELIALSEQFDNITVE